jgi:hypothetical protein
LRAYHFVLERSTLYPVDTQFLYFALHHLFCNLYILDLGNGVIKNGIPFTVVIGCSEVEGYEGGPVRCQYSETTYAEDCNVGGFFSPDIIKPNDDGECTFGFTQGEMISIANLTAVTGTLPAESCGTLPGYAVRGIRSGGELELYFKDGFIDGNPCNPDDDNACIYNANNPRLAPGYDNSVQLLKALS